jgi:hypothetical protein
MAFNNPQYGAHLIDLRIFLSHVVIKCPSKGFPLIRWNLLLEVIILFKFFSSLGYSYLFSSFIMLC